MQMKQERDIEKNYKKKCKLKIYMYKHMRILHKNGEERQKNQ